MDNYKVVVRTSYIDKLDKVYRRVGEMLDVNEDRLQGIMPFVEIVEKTETAMVEEPKETKKAVRKTTKRKSE